MQTPIQVTFQGLSSSEQLDAAIRQEAVALEQYFDAMISCHVTVSEPHRHHHRGGLYQVKIHISVPGEELVVDHEHRMHPGHEDPYLAVREAFHAARRELEDFVRRLKGNVKHHDGRSHGHIARTLPAEDCGFLTTAEGREVYFHRNSVLRGEFEDLRPGDEVTFLEEPADKGPNAKSVRLIAPRHTGQSAESESAAWGSSEDEK